MKIICLYGGVGVGKRTVGESLAKRTGFPLFHNHLTIDPALVLLPMKSKQFFPTVNRFRFALLRAAAKEKLPGVIVTASYFAKEKNAWMRGLQRIGTERGNAIHFVHLHCDEAVHLKRVQGISRKRFKKSRNPVEVKDDLQKKDFRTPHAKNALSIDTTRLSARATASRIAQQYCL